MKIKLIFLIFLISILLSACSSKVEFSERIRELNLLKNEEGKGKKVKVFYQTDSLMRELSDSLGMSDSLYVELLYIKAVAARSVKSDSVALILFDSLKLNGVKDIKRNPEPNIMSYVYSGFLLARKYNDLDSGLTEIKYAIQLTVECGKKCFKERGRATTQLASFYKSKGKLDTALIIAQNNLEFIKNNTPDYYAGIGLINTTLGNIYYQMGNTYLAELYYQRAEELYLKISPKFKLRASSLGSLGELYLENKDYNKAYEKFQDARAILKLTRPFNDYVNLKVLAGLSQALLYKDNKNSCIALVDSIVSVIGEKGPKDALSDALYTLSNYYYLNKNYKKALKNIDLAIGLQPNALSPLLLKLQIIEKMGEINYAKNLLDSVYILSSKKYNKNNFRQIPILLNLAEFAEKEEKYITSDSLIKKTEKIVQSIAGFTNLSAESLEQIAQYYRRRGKFKQSLEYFSKIVKLRSEALNSILLGSTKNWTIEYAQSLHNSVNLLISTALDADVDLNNYSSEIISAILLSKGVLSDALLKRNIRRNSNEKYLTKQENERYKVLESILSSYNLGFNNLAPSELRQYQQEYDYLTSKLIKNDSQYGSLFKIDKVNFNSIKDRLTILQKNLLEFYNFSYIKNNGTIGELKYISFYINKDGKSILLQPIEAKNIDKLVSEFEASISELASKGRYPNMYETNSIKELSKLLYQKLIPTALKDNSDLGYLIIAPDDKLNLFPFEALYDGQQYFIEKHTIEYILSGREILPKKLITKNREGILVLADPDISYLFNEGNVKQPNQDSTTDKNLQNVIKYDFKGFAKKSLPFARKEALIIKKNIENIGSTETVDIYEKKDATEKLFKEEAGKYRAIHIAAHGFYVHDSCTNYDNMNSANNRFSLSRSGIILSTNRNRRSQQNENHFKEDGLLTAKEVSSLNLSKVELVTLASCESGTGQASSGEGVYGLRRAFLIAGVNTVVSSLWQVSDQISAKFIDGIYISKGGALSRRLQESKIKEIKNLREKKLPDHPFLWAPYIVYGAQ